MHVAVNVVRVFERSAEALRMFPVERTRSENSVQHSVEKKAGTPIIPCTLPSTLCTLLSTPRPVHTDSYPYGAIMGIHN
jgi:hypothetical protein